MLYICVYVCVYVCLYVCVYVSAYVCVYVWAACSIVVKPVVAKIRSAQLLGP